MNLNTEGIINFIFYLEDKVDPVYRKEVRKNVHNFIDKLTIRQFIFFLLQLFIGIIQTLK